MVSDQEVKMSNTLSFFAKILSFISSNGNKITAMVFQFVWGGQGKNLWALKFLSVEMPTSI